MPELPEAEAVTRKLRREAVGLTIASAAIERQRIIAPQDLDLISERTQNGTVTGARRRGKQVLVALDNGHTIRVHLGMTGNVYVIPDHRFRPHTARVWLKSRDGRAIIFDDPRALGHFQVYNAEELAAVLAPLGPEPLSRSFTPATLRSILAGSRLPIKLALMDQTKVAGLGNIYAAESLFGAGIHPARIAGTIRPVRIERLHTAIGGVLKDAIQSACIAYKRPGRFAEGEFFAARVYGREGEPCGRCRRTIRRIQQGGRSTYFCPGCQT